MGSSLSCFSGINNAAIIMPIDGNEPIFVPIPSLAFDVMVDHPGHKVVKASNIARNGVVTPMYFGDELRAKKLYFLVPCNEEGSIHVDPNILQHLKKDAKKFM